MIPETPQTLTEETFCTICAQVIFNYIPEFYFDTEMGPACVSCKSVEEPIINIPTIPSIPTIPIISSISSNPVNPSISKTVGEPFKHFLEHFKDSDIENEAKYEALAKDLVETDGRILKVSISDIKKHDDQLSKSIDLNYKEAISQLCTTLEKFIKDKFGKEAPKNIGNFLVLLVP